MNIQKAYNQWAAKYDSNENKTRDLEAMALRSLLKHLQFNHCLEIGCGTGKNTEWLVTKAHKLTAVDLSPEMLAKAKKKIVAQNAIFHEGDITKEWHFASNGHDLITFSLVLEHIEDLEPIFKKATQSLIKGGHIYIGELHPFKQYTGSKARFETAEGVQVVQCFNHHLSDFTEGAKKCGLEVVSINEYFDDDDRANIPRIIAIVLQKSKCY